MFPKHCAVAHYRDKVSVVAWKIIKFQIINLLQIFAI